MIDTGKYLHTDVGDALHYSDKFSDDNIPISYKGLIFHKEYIVDTEYEECFALQGGFAPGLSRRFSSYFKYSILIQDGGVGLHHLVFSTDDGWTPFIPDKIKKILQTVVFEFTDYENQERNKIDKHKIELLARWYENREDKE